MSTSLRIALSWALVGVPLVYALVATLAKTVPLFTG